MLLIGEGFLVSLFKSANIDLPSWILAFDLVDGFQVKVLSIVIIFFAHIVVAKGSSESAKTTLYFAAIISFMFLVIIVVGFWSLSSRENTASTNF